jgi:hypothetical protein
VTVKTLNGPGGLTLVLDSKEIFPDDPGQGTPAMVHLEHRNADATFYCAVNEGVLAGSGFGDDAGDIELTSSQQRWLEARWDDVWAFMEEHTPK